MQDECPDHLSPRSHPSSRESHDTLPLQFDSPNRSNRADDHSARAYRAQMERNLAEKQADINQLESVVNELNAELSLAQTKLTDLLHQQSTNQGVQSDQIDKWRREQQASVDESKSIIQTLRDELERVNDDRELVISQLDKLQRQTNQLRADRDDLNDQLERYESETNQIKMEYRTETERTEELKNELNTMTASFVNYQGLTDQIHDLKDELEHVRDLYKEAQEEITHLSQFKRDRPQLEAQIQQNNVLDERVEHLEQESRDMDFEIAQSRDLIDQLKSEKLKTNNELSSLNEQLINSQVRQQEQQNTITELFQQIQTKKSEVEHTQYHSRDNESKLVSAQTERVKELNVLNQEVTKLKSEKDNREREIGQFKRRIDDLELQLEENAKNHEISSMGEELMTRLQRELDQQEELDHKLLSHLKERPSSASGEPNKMGGRLQELLDKVHEEGLNVLSLSELHLLKGDTDSEKQKDHENICRRLQSQCEQEKIINRDLSDALQREQQRIHDQEKRAESDRKSIEALQIQVAQSRYDSFLLIFLKYFAY